MSDLRPACRTGKYQILERQNPSQTLPLTGQGLKKISLDEKIEKVLEIMKKRHWTMGIMESCTGGAIANAITNIPGASDVFDESRITYSVESKIRAGVRKDIIDTYGVYSAETAGEMAKNIGGNPPLRRVSVGVGVTGNMNDPAEVFVAVRIEEKVWSEKILVESNSKSEIEARKEKKKQVVEKVMEMIYHNL